MEIFTKMFSAWKRPEKGHSQVWFGSGIVSGEGGGSHHDVSIPHHDVGSSHDDVVSLLEEPSHRAREKSHPQWVTVGQTLPHQSSLQKHLTESLSVASQELYLEDGPSDELAELSDMSDGQLDEEASQEILAQLDLGVSVGTPQEFTKRLEQKKKVDYVNLLLVADWESYTSFRKECASSTLRFCRIAADLIRNPPQEESPQGAFWSMPLIFLRGVSDYMAPIKLYKGTQNGFFLRRKFSRKSDIVRFMLAGRDSIFPRWKKIDWKTFCDEKALSSTFKTLGEQLFPTKKGDPMLAVLETPTSSIVGEIRKVNNVQYFFALHEESCKIAIFSPKTMYDEGHVKSIYRGLYQKYMEEMAEVLPYKKILERWKLEKSGALKEML